MSTAAAVTSRAIPFRELEAEVIPLAGDEGQAPLWLVCIPESGLPPCQVCPLASAVRMEPAFPVATTVQNGFRGSFGARQREPRAVSHHDGTVTILFTDIEGFTPLTERLGDLRAQEVLRAHNAIVRGSVATHGGFGAKSQGDGFMVAFTGARRALRCAIAIQEALATYSAERPDAPLRVRMGLHTGEASQEAGDFVGRSVIVAARIAAEARGGEILISPLVRELTDSAGEFAFDDGREVSLRGLSGRYRLFGVRWDGWAGH